MKKYLFYIVALTAAACILDGCKKEELQEGSGPAPVITVREGEKVYPSEGGTFSLLYSIENPREGVEPELSSGESWISDFSAANRRISFSLSDLIQRGGTGQRGNHPGRHGPGCNHSQGAGSFWL